MASLKHLNIQKALGPKKVKTVDIAYEYDLVVVNKETKLKTTLHTQDQDGPYLKKVLNLQAASLLRLVGE